MHIQCIIGQPYGNVSSSYSCGFHTGVDFPQSGVAAQNPDLYSISEEDSEENEDDTEELKEDRNKFDIRNNT